MGRYNLDEVFNQLDTINAETEKSAQGYLKAGDKVTIKESRQLANGKTIVESFNATIVSAGVSGGNMIVKDAKGNMHRVDKLNSEVARCTRKALTESKSTNKNLKEAKTCNNDKVYYEVTYTDNRPPKIVLTKEEAVDICNNEELNFTGDINMVNAFCQTGAQPNPDVDELISTLWTEEEGYLEADDYMDESCKSKKSSKNLKEAKSSYQLATATFNDDDGYWERNTYLLKPGQTEDDLEEFLSDAGYIQIDIEDCVPLADTDKKVLTYKDAPDFDVVDVLDASDLESDSDMWESCKSKKSSKNLKEASLDDYDDDEDDVPEEEGNSVAEEIQFALAGDKPVKNKFGKIQLSRGPYTYSQIGYNWDSKHPDGYFNIGPASDQSGFKPAEDIAAEFGRKTEVVDSHIKDRPFMFRILLEPTDWDPRDPKDVPERDTSGGFAQKYGDYRKSLGTSDPTKNTTSDNNEPLEDPDFAKEDAMWNEGCKTKKADSKDLKESVSSMDDKMDAIDAAGSYIDKFDDLISKYGANEDDSDPKLGYFAGMSDKQINDLFDACKEEVKKAILQMSSSERNARENSGALNDILDAFDLVMWTSNKGDIKFEN